MSTSLCASRTVASTITVRVAPRSISAAPSTENHSPSTTTPRPSETTGVVTVEAGTAWCTAPAENDICCSVSAATAATPSPYTSPVVATVNSPPSWNRSVTPFVSSAT